MKYINLNNNYKITCDIFVTMHVKLYPISSPSTTIYINLINSIHESDRMLPINFAYVDPYTTLPLPNITQLLLTSTIATAV